ncbi:hypothetical protein GCM10027605_64060 [Micromonospora zhanjiangensis]
MLSSNSAGSVIVTFFVLAISRPYHGVTTAERTLALDPDPAGGLRGGHRTGVHQVLVRDDLGLDEAALEVGVDDPGGLRRGRADRDGPGPGLLRPGRQVRLQAQGAEADPDQLVQTRLGLADQLQQLITPI